MWLRWLLCLLHYTIESLHTCYTLVLEIYFGFYPACEITLVHSLLCDYNVASGSKDVVHQQKNNNLSLFPFSADRK